MSQNRQAKCHCNSWACEAGACSSVCHIQCANCWGHIARPKCYRFQVVYGQVVYLQLCRDQTSQKQPATNESDHLARWQSYKIVQPHNFTCRLYACLFVQTTADLDKVVHSQVHSNSRAHTSDAKIESKALSLKTLTYAERQRDGRFISSCPWISDQTSWHSHVRACVNSSPFELCQGQSIDAVVATCNPSFHSL